MAGQLIPPPELAPPSVKHLTLDQKVFLWVDLLNTCDQLMRAGIRSRVGPDGDFETAYREALARYYDEHDRNLVKMLKNLASREAQRGD